MSAASWATAQASWGPHTSTAPTSESLALLVLPGAVICCCYYPHGLPGLQLSWTIHAGGMCSVQPAAQCCSRPSSMSCHAGHATCARRQGTRPSHARTATQQQLRPTQGRQRAHWQPCVPGKQAAGAASSQICMRLVSCVHVQLQAAGKASKPAMSCKYGG